jgi:long-chain acyl-CoA synthetase
MISHTNILELTKSYIESSPSYETDEVVSYLPLCHIYGTLSPSSSPCGRGTVNFLESLIHYPRISGGFTHHLRQCPRLWEKFASAIEIRMSDAPPFNRFIYRASIRVGMKYVQTKKKSKERFLWGLLYWPFYFAVLYHLKRQMGFERIRWAVCAAAPAAPELFMYYNALGIPLREAYGQTESTGLITIQRQDSARWGYVGEPIPNVEVKLAQDGEILARGPGVFRATSRILS